MSSNFICRALSALAAAALAMAPVAADAQASDAQAPVRPRVGALFGASLASISDADLVNEFDVGGDGAAEVKRRLGFQLGAYLTKPLTRNVSLQPELHYIQKGAKAEGTATDIEGGEVLSAEVGIKLAYVEVPLLLRVDMGSRRLRGFLVAGPAVALRVGCKASVAALGLSFEVDCDEDDDDPETPDDPFKKYDLGGIVGLGVAGDASGRAVSAQVRYSRGLVSISSETIAGYSPRNTVISILFGVGF